METNVRDNDIDLIKDRLNEIYTALMGDGITQSGGMVRRLVVVEERASAADKRSRANSLLIKWIIGTGSAILLAIFNFLIKKQ